MGIKQKITKAVASLSENLITGEDIISVLKRDHRKVTELFAEIEETTTNDIQKRLELFNRVKTELTIHSVTEERLFYSRLKQDSGDVEQVNHAYEEHNEIRNYLDRVSSLDPGHNEWIVQLKNLKNTVNHHVAEEEGKLFAEAKSVMSEQELLEIGRIFTGEKMEALNRGGLGR